MRQTRDATLGVESDVISPNCIGLRPRLLGRRLTSLRFCCAANVVTASEAREPDVYRDCSNRLLGSRLWMRSALVLVLSTRGKEPVNVRAELGTERIGVFPPPLANTRSRE